MQLALSSDTTAALRRVTIAGVAVAGAGLFAMHAPNAAGPQVQQHAVQLTAGDGEVDWSQFLSNTAASLSALQSEAGTSSTELSTALGNVSEHFSTQISDALTGFDNGINNALFGGFYGPDDGYVFGLFGGEPVLGGPTPGITGSLLEVLSNDFANISTDPNGSEQLYSDFNNYSLEVLDHTLKPLLSPLLDETSGYGATAVTVPSIPVELSEIQTNLLTAFADYNELKGVAETVLSPEISGVFALTSDLDSISAAFSSGDSATATTELNNLGSDVLNAVVNGFNPDPTGGGEGLFPGLLGPGSFLDELYTTWTTQFIDAFGTLATDSATTGSAEAVTATLPDLLGGVF